MFHNVLRVFHNVLLVVHDVLRCITMFYIYFMMFSESRNVRRCLIGDRAATDRLRDRDNSAGIGDNSAEIGDGAAGIVDIAAYVILC